MTVLIKNNLIKKNVDITNKNTLRIKTKARFYAEPENIEEIMDLFYFAEKNGIRVLFLGGGSNILFPDNEIDALVISFKNLNDYVITEDGIIADAGIKLPYLLKILSQKGLSGLEFTAGIPATLGGAIRMNLGSMGEEIFNYVKELFVYENGFLKRIRREDVKYGYRKGYTKGIILSVYLRLYKKSKKEVKEKILEILSKKRKTQPLEYPSAGCVFKNPSHDKPAGKLLDEAGLKGFQIGGAKFSEIHANFIINTGNAKSKDIKELIKIAEEKVYKKFGVKLKRELLYAEEILK